MRVATSHTHRVMTETSSKQLCAEYRGANLRVEFDSKPSAALYINNLQRHTEVAESRPHTFSLSSPVQTDYEWHEYIDAVVRISEDAATVKISTGGKELASAEFEL